MKKIQYECQHLTCRMVACHKGELVLEEEKFNLLKQGSSEPGCFVSPSSACKIGHTQLFKILGISVSSVSSEMPSTFDPTIQRIKELEKQVKDLEKRVTALEK